MPLRDCFAEFSFAGGGATAVAWFSADELHRWREVRAEVDIILRSATGRGLDAAPVLIQPEGEVLPLAAP